MIDKKTQQQSVIDSDKNLERTKIKLEIADKLILIIGVIFSVSVNVYQFCAGHKNEELIQQKTQTIDSLQQVVLGLTIQNIKAIHKDTLLTGQSDTISR